MSICGMEYTFICIIAQKNALVREWKESAATQRTSQVHSSFSFLHVSPPVFNRFLLAFDVFVVVMVLTNIVNTGGQCFLH